MSVPNTFIAHQLLARQPMTEAELRKAMDLTQRQASTILARLLSAGVAERTHRPKTGRYVYRVAA